MFWLLLFASAFSVKFHGDLVWNGSWFNEKFNPNSPSQFLTASTKTGELILMASRNFFVF